MLGEVRVRWGDALPGGVWGAGMLVGTGRSPCSPALFLHKVPDGLGGENQGDLLQLLIAVHFHPAGWREGHDFCLASISLGNIKKKKTHYNFRKVLDVLKSCENATVFPFTPIQFPLADISH